MSDQQDEWWNSNGPHPAPAHQPTDATPGGFAADAAETVVVPARQPGDVHGNPAHGTPPQQPASPVAQLPPQYGGTPPPPAEPFGHQAPPQYDAPPQGYGVAPHQAPPSYGAPQFVDSAAGKTAKYRAPAGAMTMIAGALLAILGTFLPWVTLNGFGGESESANGFEPYFIGDSFDGVEWTNPGAWVIATMVIVVLMAVIVLAAGRSIATWLLSLLTVGLAGLMTLVALAAVGSVLNALDLGTGGSSASIGFGIGMCVLGSLITGVGALVVAFKKS